MFHTLSFEPPKPHPRDVLREVEDILDARGLTFGNLITSALGETTPSLGATVVTELPSILEAFHPHFNEDEKARALLGEFFFCFCGLARALAVRKGRRRDVGVSPQQPSLRKNLWSSAWTRWGGRSLRLPQDCHRSSMGSVTGGNWMTAIWMLMKMQRTRRVIQSLRPTRGSGWVEASLQRTVASKITIVKGR